jgi:hypothetical protein
VVFSLGIFWLSQRMMLAPDRVREYIQEARRVEGADKEREPERAQAGAREEERA